MLKEPMPAEAFARFLSGRLQSVVRLMGNPDKLIRKAGLCSGGGSDEWTSAAASGCDAFISGEIKHHHALAMADQGLAAFECGHFATEEPGIRALAAALQKELNQLECNVRVYVSEKSAYAFPRQP
jgi:putative NIF3 family GTP cyclohydrolase 1 type 2